MSVFCDCMRRVGDRHMSFHETGTNSQAANSNRRCRGKLPVELTDRLTDVDAATNDPRREPNAMKHVQLVDRRQSIGRAMRYFGGMLCLLLVSGSAFGEQCVRVAVFEGSGVGPSSEKLIKALKEDSGDRYEIDRITVDDIAEGKLAEFDVLVHPGGSGGKQGRALGEEGRSTVRDFVREGGGFLGVCAGAYLATNDYSWSLGLIDAKVVDRKHWARGNGAVDLELSEPGVAFFALDEPAAEIHYAQGPLLGRREWDDPEVPDYESLAIYASEIAKKGAPEGVMKGTSAAVRCAYGDGRVFCFGPHPELTDGLEHWIPIVVEWLADERHATNTTATR